MTSADCVGKKTPSTMKSTYHCANTPVRSEIYVAHGIYFILAKIYSIIDFILSTLRRLFLLNPINV